MDRQSRIYEKQADFDALLGEWQGFTDTFPEVSAIPPSFRMLAPSSVSVVHGPNELDPEIRQFAPWEDIEGWPTASVSWNGWKLDPWPALCIRYDSQRQVATPALGRFLSGFLSLSKATDQQIANFARRRGPLGICYHGRLLSEDHGNLCNLAGLPIHVLQGPDGLDYSEPILEPIAAWRALAKHLRVILDVFRRLRDGEDALAAGTGVLWRSRPEYDPNLKSIWDRPDLVAHQAASKLDALLAAVRVRPAVTWNFQLGGLQTHLVSVDPSAREPHLGILAPILVQQAVAAASAPTRLYQCDVCSETFIAGGRRLRADRARICQNEECKRANQRRNRRESARRRRAATAAASSRTDAQVDALIPPT
jgi:hypothetical protein